MASCCIEITSKNQNYVHMYQMRTFVIKDVTSIDGCPTKFNRESVFKGDHASQAAKKALTHLCRVKRIRGRCALVITLREITRGSTNGEFTYKGIREAHRSVKVIDGKRIEFQYRVSVRKSRRVKRSRRCSGKSSGRMKKYRARSRPSRRRMSPRKRSRRSPRRSPK